MTPHTHAVAPGAAAARHLVWKIIIARTLKTGLLKRYQDPRAQNEGRRVNVTFVLSIAVAAPRLRQHLNVFPGCAFVSPLLMEQMRRAPIMRPFR